MKLRNIITSVLACVLMAVGCQQPQEFDVLKGLTVSESVVALPQDGGSVEVTVSSDAPWEVTASTRWITVSPTSGNAGDTKVTFSVLKTKKERNGEVTITSGENEQHLEFIQAYEAEGQGGPREFVKVDKVQGNKLYLVVFQKDGKPHAMKSVSTGGVSGGYNYGYGELQELTSEISADGNKITLNHQDWSYLVRTSGDGFTMQHLGNNVYLGNNAGYSSISHGDENVPGSVWKFEFLADGTVKVKNGSMWMHYSSKYGNIELTASEPAGDIPVLYEDTQDPDLPEMTWSPVSVSDVTATAASFAASFAYNGIEPLDGAGFIVKTEDANVTDKAKKEFKIKVELGADGKFSANTENLVAGVKYTVTAYLEYEGLTSKSEPVEFTTKATEAKTIKVAEFVKILKGMDLTGNVSLSAVPVDYVEGIVTAVNGDGQNLYKGLTLEDGTGEPNTGVFFYASKYNNAFAIGTKVKLALADAVASEYNGLIQIVDGELTEVSKDNEYTLAKFSADTIDFADYVGMYVTVVDAKCAAEVGTVWNDGKNSNASVDFTSKDGKVEFAAKTYKTSPWAKDIVGVKSTGNISGVVQVNKEDYSILPIKAADVAAFANTDPEIKTVSATSVEWENYSVDAVVINVTGERLQGLTAGVDNDHYSVSVSGTTVTVKPNQMNKADAPVNGVLTIAALGGNSVKVALKHNGAVAFKAGKYWMIASDLVATPLSATKNYGYLPTVAAVKVGDAAASVAANAFTFTEVEGGYTIQDPAGRYYYQKGTYDSYNVSAEMPEAGAVWSVEVVEGGAYKITNLEMNKYIQYDAAYGTYGSYATARGVMPVLVDASNPVEEGGNEGGEPAANSVTLDFVALGLDNAAEVGTQVVAPVTFVCAVGSNSSGNLPKYYTSGTAVRCYPGNTITISSTKTITKIEVIKPSYDHKLAISADKGSYQNDVWIGSSDSVVLTFDKTASSGQTRVSKIVVTYAE